MRLAKVEDSTPPGPPKRLRLFVASEGGFTTHQLPEPGEVTLGLDPSCGVVVDDKSVAPRHAILSLGPPVRVEDMGSGLHTSVGDKRIGPGHAVELAPGDIVHFGGVIAMVE